MQPEQFEPAIVMFRQTGDFLTNQICRPIRIELSAIMLK